MKENKISTPVQQSLLKDTQLNSNYSIDTSHDKNFSGDELRCAKRIAEGLRPINNKPGNNQKISENKRKIKSNTLKSSSASSCSSVRSNSKPRMWTNKTFKNKINSNSSINSDTNSLFDSSNESELYSTEITPSKKRLLTKKRNLNRIIDSDEEENKNKNEDKKYQQINGKYFKRFLF